MRTEYKAKGNMLDRKTQRFRRSFAYMHRTGCKVLDSTKFFFFCCTIEREAFSSFSFKSSNLTSFFAACCLARNAQSFFLRIANCKRTHIPTHTTTTTTKKIRNNNATYTIWKNLFLRRKMHTTRSSSIYAQQHRHLGA